MKYIMIMQFPFELWKTESIEHWPPQDIQAHINFLNRFNKELSDAGELVGIEALVGPDQAKLIKANPDGKITVTDGPFAESKEFLAGYWIIDVDTPERAYELAGRASAAPGPGGKPLNMQIEVRQVMSGPGDL